MKSRILIIDDDEEIVGITKTILETQGYVVDQGRTAADLFLSLGKFAPDLILMDIWLNTTNGNILTHALKENPKTKDIPVILFSALSLTKSVTKEADGFLRKPYDLEVLLDLLDQHLKGKKSYEQQLE